MSTSQPHDERQLAMTVHNIGFLLDRLGQDCHPLQFLRELTQNSIEAVVRTKAEGEIRWDVDWNTHDLEDQFKLCIIDNGDGMTGDEMVKFINQLSSSVAEQSLSGNYGVGAKIATATRNHFGIIYLSWKSGQGSMIQMYRDSVTQQYGLKQWRRSDGSYGHFLPIDDDVKPTLINDHGTCVILLGNSESENTMQAPPASPSPSRWISKYLNTRYFEFPEGISLKAREGWDYPRTDTDRNYLRSLTGQKPYLESHCQSSGTLELNDAKALWWILKEEPAVTNNSGFIESSGHVAALYQNELYELTTARAGMSRLQQFGITFGYRFVVIYIEPSATGDARLTTNTARTQLLLDNDALPWADWAAEFRENIPDEIETFVRTKAAKSIEPDHSKSIRERLKDIMDLFKLSRYRPTPEGDILIDTERLVRGGAARQIQVTRTRSGRPSGTEGGTTGNVYAVFERKDGTPGQKVTPDPFPRVRWVSVKDGTREHGYMEDRAARFLPEQNLLLINGDFRVFADMEKFFGKEYASKAGTEEQIRDSVHAWFEQALVETVMGVQALHNSKEWSPSDVESALTEEALTTSVMQRYHIHFAVKRELGLKLGATKN